MPAGRPARLGPDRAPVTGEGVQRRVQVRRPARRSRGSDAGHLPQGLQIARHVRPARQLPDMAHQREPQPVHRSLPQRPQGARDDRSRRGCQRAVASVAGRRARSRRSSRPTASTCCAGRWARCRSAADGGGHARHPGTVVSGDRRPAASAGRHGEVAHQPRSNRARPADPEAGGADYSEGGRPTGAQPRTGAY